MFLNKVTKILFFLHCAFVLLGSSAYAERKVNWKAVNPLLKDSVPIAQSGNPDDETECLLCHKGYIKAFGKTVHAKALTARFGAGKLGTLCETCHGPLSGHLKEMGIGKGAGKKSKDPRFMVSFKRHPAPAPARNAVCLQCHQGSQGMMWKGSAHEMGGVTCNSCHYVSRKTKKHKRLILQDPKKVCYQCHRGIRAKMRRTSHMPLSTDKYGCQSCHNAHGGPGPALLNRSSVNETCYQCHQEKRGPYIFEHAPVRENCMNCHRPHGSSFIPMLKQKPPFLCQQCHMNVFHPSNVYDGQSVRNRSSYIGRKGCVNCHSLIHGSNHPSGARFQR